MKNYLKRKTTPASTLRDLEPHCYSCKTCGLYCSLKRGVVGKQPISLPIIRCKLGIPTLEPKEWTRIESEVLLKATETIPLPPEEVTPCILKTSNPHWAMHL